MKKRKRFILWAILVLIPLAMILIIVTNVISARTVAEWRQPATVDYSPFGPYVLRVVEMPDWGWLGLRRKYCLFVAVADEADMWYGYLFDLPPDVEQTDGKLQKANVTWTSNGVSFDPVQGTKVSVPAKEFLSSR